MLDEDYLNMEVQAHIQIEPNGLGTFSSVWFRDSSTVKYVKLMAKRPFISVGKKMRKAVKLPVAVGVG